MRECHRVKEIEGIHRQGVQPARAGLHPRRLLLEISGLGLGTSWELGVAFEWMDGWHWDWGVAMGGKFWVTSRLVLGWGGCWLAGLFQICVCVCMCMIDNS